MSDICNLLDEQNTYAPTVDTKEFLKKTKESLRNRRKYIKRLIIQNKEPLYKREELMDLYNKIKNSMPSDEYTERLKQEHEQLNNLINERKLLAIKFKNISEIFEINNMDYEYDDIINHVNKSLGYNCDSCRIKTFQGENDLIKYFKTCVYNLQKYLKNCRQ